MNRTLIAALAAALALASCEDNKPVFIEYTGAYPSADASTGKPEDVWRASATGYVEQVYYRYRRGGHINLMPEASAELLDAIRYGKLPPLDPLCDCTTLERVRVTSEVQDVKPPLNARVLVAFDNAGRTSSIYLYLEMTPLGFRIADIATPSMRLGLLNYLRSNKKSDQELEDERIKALERGECPPLDNGC